MENETFYPLPLKDNKPKLAPGAGFSFIKSYGAKMGAKYIDYKPAEIYKGKKWYVFYSYRNPVDGKFKRFRVYEDLNRIKGLEKEEFAIQLRDAINYGLSQGFNPFELEKLQVVKKWTLNQGLNYFKQNLPQRGLRKRSQQLYGSVLKFLYKYLPGQNNDIENLTRIQIQSAFRRAQVEKKWSNSTYNNYITFTRTIFNFLINEEILTENPCKIKYLPENYKRHRYFSGEVFDKIKENALPELLRFIMFLYHTGIRPNEAIQLKYENIIRDKGNERLFIPASISKNKKDGYVPLTDYVLNNYKGEGNIFEPIDRHYTRMFAKLKKKLKLDPETTLYSIKHSRGIHLAQDGADPYTIMKLFRHSSLTITMAYLRDLNVGTNKEAVEKGIKF